MSKISHVTILIETSREYGRGLLRGISQYLEKHEPWSVYFAPHGLNDPPPVWLPRWSGDGILARINNRRMANAITKTGLPAIDLLNKLPNIPGPKLGPDNKAVSKLAFEHLLESGFRHFAYCSMLRGRYWFIDSRCNHFKSLVKESGNTYSEFHFRDRQHQTVTWEQEQQQNAQWLKQLPKPVGIMTGNDEIGQRVLDASLRVGIVVPDEVAVVSVDNDQYLCNLSNPSLTSIDVNLEKIGYEAAAMLDRMMAGKKPAKTYTEFQPKGVVIRRSTDVLAIDNVEIAVALRFIREHACDPINVEQVTKWLAVSRSSLTRLFKVYLGRTPKEEIIRVQLNRARELLANSDLSLLTVANKSGFNNYTHFSSTFRRNVGIMPREYRKQFKY